MLHKLLFLQLHYYKIILDINPALRVTDQHNMHISYYKRFKINQHTTINGNCDYVHR
jgi:hypothetical protein